jgi:microcystin-dependent protein
MGERRHLRSPGETPDHALGGVPIGTILDFAGPTAPDGFLICDGSAYDSGNYPDLFAVIGTAWGGDGSPNFNVPDLRDTFTKGKGTGDNVGDSGGSANANHTHDISLSESNLPSHSHSINHGHTINQTSRTLSHTGNSPNVSWDSHSHLYCVGSGGGNTLPAGNLAGGSQYFDSDQITNSDSHSHSVSITHTHASHNHNVSVNSHNGNSGSTGSGDSATSTQATIDNRPPYKTVNKIIKY